MKKSLIPFCIFFMLLQSCGNGSNSTAGLPSLTTTTPYDIGADTATSGGTISSDGGSAVTERGVCWDTNPGPTISNDRTQDGTGTGNFTSNITGLTSGTTYYLRAYATNSMGTNYGNEETWVTAGPASFVDSRDGNSYPIVTIGSQTWMATNLKYLPEVHSNAEFENRESPGYGVYGYNGSVVAEAKASSFYAKYGVMYNWHAALNACPSGWHLPSSAEWDELVGFIASDGHSGTEGTALKATYDWSCGLAGTDNYGFSALPGGIRSFVDGRFFDASHYSEWWTSTAGNACCAAYRELVCSLLFVASSEGGNRSAGYYVRCLRD